MEKLKNKTPLVRFPEFKEDWEHKQLNELLSVSKTKNGDLKYGKNEVLSVSGDLGIVNQIEHLGRSYAGASVHNYGVVELNQIVYTKSPLKANPYGIIKLNKHKAGIVSTLYAVYNVNEETDGQFIEYYFSLDANLNRYLRPLVRKGAKNDMKISNEYVLNDRIYAPQLKEQKKIAHFFSIVDKKLTQLQEKKTALELYKKGMMQQLFCPHYDSDDLDDEQDFAKDSQEKNQGNQENQKKSKFRLRFKDDNGQDFPDWEVKKLGEVCEVNPKSQNLPNSFIYIDLESVENGRLIKEERISIDNSPSRAQRLLMRNDILFQMVRPYQKNNYFLDKSSLDYVASTGYAQIRTKNNSVFIYQMIHSQIFVNKVIVKCTGTSYPAINSTDLKSIKIQLPSIKEQTKIANFLSKIDNKINTATEKIEQTKEYKKGLLQQMFCN